MDEANSECSGGACRCGRVDRARWSSYSKNGPWRIPVRECVWERELSLSTAEHQFKHSVQDHLSKQKTEREMQQVFSGETKDLRCLFRDQIPANAGRTTDTLVCVYFASSRLHCGRRSGWWAMNVVSCVEVEPHLAELGKRFISALTVQIWPEQKESEDLQHLPGRRKPHTCEWHANKSALHQHIGERSLLQAISRTLPDSWSVCKVVHQCWPNLIKINNRTDNFSKHPTSQRRRVRPEEQLPISLPLAGRLEEPTCWALNWKIWSRNSSLELKF